MSDLLKLFLTFYVIGFIMTFLLGLDGIRNHVTCKGLVATFIMSLFSFCTLLYMILGNDNKNNYPY